MWKVECIADLHQVGQTQDQGQEEKGDDMAAVYGHGQDAGSRGLFLDNTALLAIGGRLFYGV